jgi:hypothetical protein
MSVTSRTLSCGNVRSNSRMSLVLTQDCIQNTHTFSPSNSSMKPPSTEVPSYYHVDCHSRHSCLQLKFHLRPWQSQMSALKWIWVSWLHAGIKGKCLLLFVWTATFASGCDKITMTVNAVND